MSIEEQVSTRDMFQMCISYDEINSLYVYLQRVKHLYGTCRSTCCQKKKKKLPSVPYAESSFLKRRRVGVYNPTPPCT